jgi:hypothetical protein
LFSVVFVSVVVEAVLLLQHDFVVPSDDFSPEQDLVVVLSAVLDLQQALSLSHFFFFLSFFSSPLVIEITWFPASDATEDAEAAPTIPVNAKRKNNFFIVL